ncbi:MAG: beta-ketoacyl-[acyl-carrier-protein] synthase family protein [Bacteroidota bacterium]
MKRRRVVVTGIGAVTPIGHSAQGLWAGVRENRCGIRTIDRFPTDDIRTTVAAQVDDFDPLDYFDAKLVRRMDRFAQMAVAGCDMAVKDADLELDPSHPNPRIGVTMGTALGGVAGAEREHEKYLQEGIRGVNTNLALVVFGGSGSSNIAIRFGLSGPSNANSNSCSSGSIAIGEAYRYIRHGYADAMIAASAEAPLYKLTFSAFTLIRTMSVNPDPQTACRPFDRHRDGFVMGELSAVLVLEELGHALRRNARIYSEILGYACNNDAHHMVAPRADGVSAARAITDAIEDAGRSPSEIEYINAHASATQLNDRVETGVLKRVFGARASQIPISGTKAMHGHALGASGALEAAICCLVLQHDYLPPTLQLSTPDPDCDLDYIPNTGRHKRVDTILSNAFGFGGINATLVIGRYES